jgi:hypothetical protein
MHLILQVIGTYINWAEQIANVVRHGLRALGY